MKKIFLCFILIITATASSMSFDRLLRSPQYLLVSHYKCGTIIEAAVNGTNCPLGLTPHIRPFKKCEYDIRLSLIRDPNGVHPPKLLYVASPYPFSSGPSKSASLHFMINDIKVSLKGKHFSEYQQINVSRENWTTDAISSSEIISILYDSNTQLLYIIHKTRGVGNTLYCTLYYLKSVFSEYSSARPFIKQIGSFGLHPYNSIRYNWTVDPYSNMVYYSTIDPNNKVLLYAVNINRLMEVLLEGESGKTIFISDSETVSHFRVSADIIFSYRTKNGSEFGRMKNIAYAEEKGMTCQYRKDESSFRKPITMSTIVIRDDDYCMLRDGKSTNRSQCEQERIQWRFENNITVLGDHLLIEKVRMKVEEGGSGWCTALFVICLVLAFLLVTSCFCLCWMKRNLDSTFEENGEPPRSIPYYTGGRHGQYNEDISVDVWNSNY